MVASQKKHKFVIDWLMHSLNIFDNIFKRMLNLCQKVNIQHIENHYHYRENPKSKKPNINSKVLSQLRVQPIVSTQIKSRFKSFSHLSRSADAKQHFQGYEENKHPHRIQQITGEVFWKKINPSPKNCQQNLLQNKVKSNLQSVKNSQEKITSEMKIHRLQGLKRKSKPNVYQNVEDIDLRILITPFKNQTSGMEETTASKFYHSQKLNEITTNLNSNIQSEASNSLDLRKRSVKDSSFLLSKSTSSRKSQLRHIYCKDPSKSIILSRDSLFQESKDSLFQESNDRNTLMPKINLWHDNDRKTIFSRENDGTSEHSIKVQESFICEREGKKNFEVLKEYYLKDNEKIQLGYEVSLGCLVSIREINMSQMNIIARQMQIYELFDYSISGEEEWYKNILALYQVQISHSSYLLIKQPFTLTVHEYLRNVNSCSEWEEKVKYLQQILASLLLGFSNLKLFPDRLIGPQDFVVSYCIVKFHNVSIFKQTDHEEKQIQVLMEHFSKKIRQVRPYL